MYCPECGTPNPGNAERCVKCQKVLPKISPTGELIPAATPAQPQPAEPAPPPPQPFYPGLPGSQYSYVYGQPGPGQYQYPPNYVPYYNYSLPVDRVGVPPVEASFWPRFGAYIIDNIIVGIISGLLFFVPLIAWFVNFFVKHQSELVPVCDSTARGYNSRICNAAIERALERDNDAGLVILFFVGLMLMAVVVPTLYYTLQTARGTTIGKRVFGLRVVKQDGTPPGFGRALLRHTVGYWVSSILLGVGFLWIAFDPRHQGWHDKIAGTYVVKNNT